MKKGLLALVIAAMLLLQLLPAAALAEEPVTLEVVVYLHELTKDPSEIDVFRQIEEMANVKFDWTVIRSGWDEKKADHACIRGSARPDPLNRYHRQRYRTESGILCTPERLSGSDAQPEPCL